MSYKSPPQYIDNLLILRGLCSLGVVAAHCLVWLETAGWALLPALLDWLRPLSDLAARALARCWLSNGYSFVYVFFIMSGYLMGKIYWNRQYELTRGSLLNFYRGRLLRIAPLLFVNLVVCLLFTGKFHLLFSQWDKVLGDFLFINNLTGYCLNQVTWSLSFEMQDYLICPLFFLLFARKNWRCLTGALLLTVLLTGYGYYSISMPYDRWLALARFSWNFLGGYSVNLIIRYLHENLKISGGRRSAAAGFVLFFVSIALFNALANRNFYFSAQLQLQALIMLSLVLLELPAGRERSGALVPGPVLFLKSGFTWLGRISYGVYLWHLPIIIASLSSDSKLLLGLRVVYAQVGSWLAVPEVMFINAAFFLLVAGQTIVISLATFWLVETRFRPNLYRFDQSQFMLPLARRLRGLAARLLPGMLDDPARAGHNAAAR